MHRVRRGEFAAVLPGHALTTLHYILEKYSGTALANQTLDGLLADFAILRFTRWTRRIFNVPANCL